jgi:hypothetical protein
MINFMVFEKFSLDRVSNHANFFYLNDKIVNNKILIV